MLAHSHLLCHVTYKILHLFVPKLHVTELEIISPPSVKLKIYLTLCRDGKKKQNCKCVRYDVNGECRVILVATRDVAKGERLYYDYNGHEHEYPTQHFV